MDKRQAEQYANGDITSEKAKEAYIQGLSLIHILHLGWRALDAACKAMLKDKTEKEDAEKLLPIVTDGEVLELISASVKEGKTCLLYTSGNRDEEIRCHLC